MSIFAPINKEKITYDNTFFTKSDAEKPFLQCREIGETRNIQVKKASS